MKYIDSGRLVEAKTPHSPHMNLRVLPSAAILKRLVYLPLFGRGELLPK
jgi:hypothetical protein